MLAHLDMDIPEFGTQQQQATDLVNAVGNTTLPIVITGDFNNSYGHYPQLSNAGFRDAWVAGELTCCQDMQSLTLARQEKIDLILLRGGVSTTRAHLVGGTALQKCTPAGCALWASDHAGVLAGLHFPVTNVAVEINPRAGNVACLPEVKYRRLICRPSGIPMRIRYRFCTAI